MEQSGIMNYLRTDKELSAMRKEWKESGIEGTFPPFNFDEYNGLEEYKSAVRTLLNDYHKHEEK